MHRYRCVALSVGNQCFFAERVTDLQFGQLDAFLAKRGFARYQRRAANQHVKIIAFGSLLEDDVTRTVIDLLHAHEDRLNIGRRNLVKCLGLQQHRHPVFTGLVGLALQIGYFVGTGLVPGQHHIQKITVDGNELHPVSCASRHSAGIDGCNRIASEFGAALNGSDNLPFIDEFENAANDIQRALLCVSLFKEQLARRHFTNLYLARKRRKIVPFEAV